MYQSIFDRVPAGTEVPYVANAIVEIPKGRRTKFELDKRYGIMRMDRFLYSSSQYPGDYGFIPQTLAEDGDPLDILVMVNEPTFCGCLIRTRVVGLFKMRDAGAPDYKVLAVPHSDPLFNDYRDLNHVPQHYLREVEHFFATYKELEGVKIDVEGWSGADDARQEVRDSVDRYVAKIAAKAKGDELD